MIKQPVLCLCNYGMVRSKTMCNRLRFRGIMSAALGMMNTAPVNLYGMMERAGTIVICNQPNVDEEFAHEPVSQILKDNMKEMLKLFKDKMVVCDTIGFDVWAKENHPDLVAICDEYIERINAETM